MGRQPVDATVERDLLGHACPGRGPLHSRHTCDILPGVNAGASRTAVGIFAGLRHDLFSRVKRPALAVEQVCRRLCHTAVTPILTMRTRSYLLTHILRPVAISIPDQPTR
ncbi:MAG: hypothetical protein J07HR59_01064, partial [Halorubrum sp. J07HR59]